MSGQRIHITVDLEDLIRQEIRDMEALPLYGATTETQYQRLPRRRHDDPH